MKTTIIIDECYIGTQFPCALEYGDLTGLEEEEEQDLNNWLALQTVRADKHTKFPSLRFEYKDESEFETCEITRLRGNCVACKVFILVEEYPCDAKAMTESQARALRELRNAGYAVCTLDPVGLCGADPGRIEDLMLKKALTAIQALQERTKPWPKNTSSQSPKPSGKAATRPASSTLSPLSSLNSTRIST